MIKKQPRWGWDVLRWSADDTDNEALEGVFRRGGHCGRFSHDPAKESDLISFSRFGARSDESSSSSFAAVSFVSLPLFDPQPQTITAHFSLSATASLPPRPSWSLPLARGFLNREHLTCSPPTRVSLCNSLWPRSTLSHRNIVHTNLPMILYSSSMFEHNPWPHVHTNSANKRQTAAVQSLATAVFHCLTGSRLTFEAADGCL